MLSIARLSFGRVALCRREFHLSAASLVKMVENVPALGESITEGTIASWAKKVGDKVNVDDVIVVIETDKVTVDVKAVHAGVLTQQLAVDNVSTKSQIIFPTDSFTHIKTVPSQVLVGKPLYEIDTDGSVSVPSGTSTPSAPAPSTPAPVATSSHKSHSTRKHLIKFVGKRSLVKKEEKIHHPVAVVERTVQVPVLGTGRPTEVPFLKLKDKFMHGRPKMSAKEMDAITSGGAY
eukprot:gene25343-30604_t